MLLRRHSCRHGNPERCATPHSRTIPKPERSHVNPALGTSPFFITHRTPTPGIHLIRSAIIAGLIPTFLVSLAAYPVLPDQIITHWNAAGEPDGSMGKPAGIGLVPLITAALVALLLFLPLIDPLRKNYAAFRDWYDGFILAFVLFMLAIQCQVILWSLGHRISMNLKMSGKYGRAVFFITGPWLKNSSRDRDPAGNLIRIDRALIEKFFQPRSFSR